MKQFFKLSLVIILSAWSLSCNTSGKEKKNEVAEKQKELQTKKDQVTKLNGDIKKLEADIAKLDPSTVKAEQAKLVALTPLATESFTHFIDLQGRVDAENTSYVAPRGMGGQVRAVYVKEGDMVRKGQLLLKMDDAVLRENLQTAKTQLGYAENIYQRYKNLWDQNIGSEVQLVTYKNNVDLARRNIATIQEQLSYTNVYAQVSGVAEQVNIRVGETFTGAPTSGIMIVNTSNLKVVVQVPENYLSRVKKGTPVQITIPDISRTFNSTISLIGQTIGATSRGFTAECKLPADAHLKANQVAMVKIQDYTAPKAITIPVSVLQTDENGKFVLVAQTEKGKMTARKKPIGIGELYGDQVEVKTGLQIGDTLISQGFQSLYEGQLITTTK